MRAALFPAGTAIRKRFTDLVGMALEEIFHLYEHTEAKYYDCSDEVKND